MCWWLAIGIVALLAVAPPRTIVTWLPPEVIELQTPFGHRAGFAYVASAPAGVDPDSDLTPRASSLQLLEDGKPLAPPHTLHAVVENVGRGAYSHWGDGIVFSSSDNSDPNTNGRRYSVEYPPALGGAVLWLYPILALPVVLLLPALSYLVGRLRSRAATRRAPAGSGSQ
jgi:hypothetical protein